MRTIRISLILSLLTISSHGRVRVVRRSIQNKPFASGKELLSMKGASDVIKRSFQRAREDLEELSDTLKGEIASLAELSHKIKHSETENILGALIETMDIQSLVDDQREELRKLASQTIMRSKRILSKFRETVARRRELDRGVKDILTEMGSLLLESVERLEVAKEVTKGLREKMNNVMATLRVFKSTVQAVKNDTLELEEAATANTICEVANVISLGIEGIGGLFNIESVGKIPTLIESLHDGANRVSDSLAEVLNSQEISDMLSRALSTIDGTVGIVSTLQESINGEVQLIIDWRDNVDIVKYDVFQGNLEGGSEQFQDLFDEIKEIIGDGDVDEIYVAFNELENAAQSYLDHINS